jgi:hypothetical protein
MCFPSMRYSTQNSVFVSYVTITALKMETICFSETMVPTYESTRRHNPEEEHRQLVRRENLKSPTLTPNALSVTKI